MKAERLLKRKDLTRKAERLFLRKAQSLLKKMAQRILSERLLKRKALKRKAQRLLETKL